MCKRITLISGGPGVGKTTVIIKTAEILKAQGYKIGGIVTNEKREGDVRVGFEIQDLAAQRRGWLAQVNQLTGPRIGKYRVNLDDLERVGTNAIKNAIKNADIIIIDEIGPMELFSKTFKESVTQAMDSVKPVIATVHGKNTDPFVSNVKAHQDSEVYEITTENRDLIHNFIIEKINRILSR